MRLTMFLVAAMVTSCAQTWAPDDASNAPLGNSIACSPVQPQIPASLRSDPNFRGASLKVQFELLPSLEIGAVRVTESSGYSALDGEAIAAVQQYRRRSSSVLTRAVTITVPFNFSMGGSAATQPRP
jgi:TonB family protein